MRKIKNALYKPKWESEINREFSEKEIEKLADEMLEWITNQEDEVKNMNFWLNDFAVQKMLTPSQLNSFSFSNKYFEHIYHISKLIQESKLLKMALYKEVNSTPAVFILKSVIGLGEADKEPDLNSAKKQIEEIFEQ
jgi:hypothetical protein